MKPCSRTIKITFTIVASFVLTLTADAAVHPHSRGYRVKIDPRVFGTFETMIISSDSNQGLDAGKVPNKKLVLRK